MRAVSLSQFFAVAALFLTSCDRPAIKPGDSLVGARELPSATALSREIIQINQGFRSMGTTGLLTYELRPENKLTITLTHHDRVTLKEVTDGKESFQLTSDVASRVRRKLWRLRPETLRGIEWVTRPSDCPPPPTDTFPDASIAFIAEGPKPGIEDDRLGLTDVPSSYTCKTKQGDEARTLTQRVLQSFPASKVAAEFDRRELKVMRPSQPPHTRQP